MDTDKLWMELLRTLTDLQKISSEFSCPIIFSIPMFYNEKRNHYENLPLIVKFWKNKILQLKVTQIEAITLLFCEPVIVFRLQDEETPFDVPAGYFIDLNTDLFSEL